MNSLRTRRTTFFLWSNGGERVSVAIVGLGVLGTRVLKLLPQDLHIILIDHDIVVEKNLHRQYPAEYLGYRKAFAAQEAFHRDSEAIHKHLDLTTVGLLAEAELVVDCTDNMLTRRVINDYCTREGIPWVHGALSDRAGALAVFLPGSPCFSCLYPSGTGETCTEALDLRLADATARAVAREVQSVLAGTANPIFIRTTAKQELPFALTKRPQCPTCAGSYPYLDHGQNYYITYCQNSHCMAAKPVVPRSHDHGEPEERVVRGIPIAIYPNGEIHFLIEADADVLNAIAQDILSK